MHNLVMITHNYIMHNAYMQALDNLCYLVHNPRRDHMYFVHCMMMARRENHDMISRNPKC